MPEIEKALDGQLSPDEIKDQLKDLVDLGVIAESVNPMTKQKEFKKPNDKKPSKVPKLMPILNDLLEKKKGDKVSKKDIEKACKGVLSP